MAYRLLQRVIASPDIDGDHGRAGHGDADIKPQFLVKEHTLDFTQQQQIEAGKVHAEKEHEHRRHILQIGAVAGHTVVLDAEASGARRAIGGTEGLEQRHVTGHQENHVQHGQKNINQVEDLRRLFHLRHQLAHLRAGALRPQQVHGIPLLPLSSPGDGQQKHQHTHASQPVAETPPAENSHGQALHIRHHGSSRCGKSGYHLKECVHIVGNRPG